MTKTKTGDILLGILALLLMAAVVWSFVNYAGLHNDASAETERLNAEISRLESELASYGGEEAEKYLADAAAAEKHTAEMKLEIYEFKTDIETKRSESEELLKEKDYYTEIYNELLTGKEKVEGYIAAGN